MKTFVAVALLVSLSTLSFAQSKQSVKKPKIKTDSTAAVEVKEIAWDQKTGKFIYPASMTDAEKIEKLETALKQNSNTFMQAAGDDAKYSDALETVLKRKDAQIEQLKGLVQQLQAKLQPPAGQPK
ncbi:MULTISPECIES: hypothetical protein [unclassified Spirosoma]|uniref:hypothetical protein n=1 Tax=unclassified Spirosoma TaxID=2621999 RepID=UPI00095B210C|nr:MULTISPECIES: hypothetical protein [unclassified Spirosoma]MBN8820762.1 hypothetical protein [Spirosoma sp.]OJW78060.1 MAG: hypothetical protein BGO59_29010 [Spirosoma sp. 48-14]